MNFKTENIDNNVIFTILDNILEGKSASELKSRILVVAQPDINALIIDISNISIITSSGLSALILTHKQLKDFNIPVILIGIQSFVKKLLQITRLEEIFQYFDTVEAAVSNIKK